MAIFDRFKSKQTEDSSPKEPPAASQEPLENGAVEPKAGVFARFRRGLRKTSDLLNTDIRDLLKQEGRLLDEEFLDELFAMLVKTDMGAGPANAIRDRVQSDQRGRVVKMDEVLASVESSLRELMAQDQAPIQLAADGPDRDLGGRR